MGKEIRDYHVSKLQLITESNQLTPPSSKYQRISIPDDPNRHCLGWLEGPAASLIESTRNDRLYNIMLWRNVLSDVAFLEGMQNAIIVGENDHPEERVDYSLENGSIILAAIEIREDEGIVWARFAILDNEHGRQLLSYLKFGSIVGVSSRGIGDEIVENGVTLIDPNTYEFFCFDVVAFPAAAVARQSYIDSNIVKEAVSIDTDFHNRVHNAISEATTIESLDNLKRVIESTNVSDKAALVETIQHKLSSLSESADNQSTVNDEVTDVKELQAKLEAKDAEIAKLQHKLKTRKENAQYFRRTVQEQGEELAELESAVTEGINSIEELSVQLESVNADKRKLKARHEAQCKAYNTLKSNAHLSEQAHRKEISSMQSRISELERVTESLESELSSTRTQLTEANRTVSNEKQRVLKLKSENRQFRNDIALLESELADSASARKTALKESRAVQTKISGQVKTLTENVSTLKSENSQLKSKVATTEKTLKESQSQVKQLKQSAVKMLKEYLKKSCDAANLKYEHVFQRLPENFTKSDIDDVITEMVDRQQRYDKLPISVQSAPQRVVEHKSADNSEGLSTFVVEALRKGANK